MRLLYALGIASPPRPPLAWRATYRPTRPASRVSVGLPIALGLWFSL